MTTSSRPEIGPQILRALTGEFVPELDADLRAIIERVRDRLRHQCVAAAVDAYRDGGMAALESRWRELVDEVFEQSIAAVEAITQPDLGGESIRAEN